MEGEGGEDAGKDIALNVYSPSRDDDKLYCVLLSTRKIRRRFQMRRLHRAFASAFKTLIYIVHRTPFPLNTSQRSKEIDIIESLSTHTHTHTYTHKHTHEHTQTHTNTHTIAYTCTTGDDLAAAAAAVALVIQVSRHTHLQLVTDTVILFPQYKTRRIMWTDQAAPRRLSSRRAGRVPWPTGWRRRCCPSIAPSGGRTPCCHG